MRVWATANQKGGVGKTTTVVSLGGLLAVRGSRVLLVDLDPHGSLTSYFGLDPETADPSVYTLFGANAPVPTPAPTGYQNLWLLPAATALATLDRQLAGRDGKGLVVARALRQLAGRFDFALLDCPPMLGVLLVNALAACELLIVPVQTEFLALKGLERMLHTLAMIQRARKTALPYLIVPTLFDAGAWSSVESLQTLSRRHRAELWDGAIPLDAQFPDASRAGMPLPLANAAAPGAVAYASLLETLLHDGAQSRRAAEGVGA